MGPKNDARQKDEKDVDEITWSDVNNDISAPLQETVDSLQQLAELRIFGYGSILWNTGFEYETAEVGYIEGYARRFWQGNTTHRGTPESPGRVATLVKESDSQVWGMVYHVVGTTMIQKCLEHLGVRECILGGYSFQLLPFKSKSYSHHAGDDLTRHLALAFIASPGSEQYLGPTELDEIANQVVACHGTSGSNAEYVIRLAEFVRAHIPEDDDDHLFELDQKVCERLHAMNLAKMTIDKMTNGSALQRTESSSHDARKRSIKSSEAELIKSLVSETLYVHNLEMLKT